MSPRGPTSPCCDASPLRRVACSRGCWREHVTVARAPMPRQTAAWACHPCYGVTYPRRGVVLVAVLLVTVLVTMVAASLMFRMRAETASAGAEERGEQAYAAAVSGLQFALAVLKVSSSDMASWYDNPDIFQNQLVVDDGSNRWYFTIYGDDPTEQGTPRIGLTDEAGKINLNTATPETLLSLKNMTTELVDCLIDYRDADSDLRPEGAEQEYYDGLRYPYVIPNGPLATVEEALLIKGFSGPVVYGEDANFNGILDPNEDDGDDTFPPDNRDGRLDRGLRALGTVYSSEPSADSTGKPRININGETLTRVPGLSAQAAEFILVYRAEGNQFTHAVDLLEMRYQLKETHKEAPYLKEGAWIESGVKGDDLPLILDRLTVQATERNRPVTGLVNVNTAPVEVLATLPGMDANLAQQIVDLRRDLDPATKSTIAWLYTQNLLDAAAFKQVAPYLTARSFQFTARCVGFGVPCGRYRVIEAVLDLSGSVPRLAYMRDISRLGLPFTLDPDLMQRTHE